METRQSLQWPQETSAITSSSHVDAYTERMHAALLTEARKWT